MNKKSDGTFETRCDAATKKYKDQKYTPGFKKGSFSFTAQQFLKTTLVRLFSADCDLPEFTGPCEAAIPRYFYNRETKACERFVYGGCQANANNFGTKAACEAACKA